jgi:hypothetical protein
VQWLPGRCLAVDARGDTSQSRQLERRSPQIDADDQTEHIDFDALLARSARARSPNSEN